MNRTFTKFSYFLVLMCLGIGTINAQTFCLQMTEVSNDGVNSVVSIGVQGDASFVIGSSNLQFAYTNGAFGTPTLLSTPLAPPFYFTPTVTTPGLGIGSLNIELAFTDASGSISGAPGFTEIAVINLPIADASLAANGVSWQYNGGTTQTVIFLDDEATQLFATSTACLVGYTPTPPAINGCIDSAACNYDTNANTDDGSCVFATGCDTCSGETDGTGVVVDNPEVGDVCDDGNAATENDVIMADCACSGILPAGPGENCDNAISITNGTITSPGILAAGGISATNACFTGATNAIWYEYTASCSGLITISSSIDLDEPDTRVSVHSDCNNFDCIASDDDGGEGFTSITTFNGTAGETFFIEWDDRWDDGEFDFSVTCGVALNGCTDATACNFNAAANTEDGSCVFATGCDTCSGETDGTGTVIDNPEVGESCDDGDPATTGELILANCTCGVVSDNECLNAIPVGDGITTSAGIQALGGPTATNTCFAGGTNAVWYEYTASCSGITTVSSSIDLDEPDTRVSIHSDCSNLDCIGFDDDGGAGFTSIATFTSVAGETYLIEWDDRWADGEFDFEISCAGSSAGCTDVTACNYNVAANSDDGSCVFAAGCDTCSGETDGSGTVIDNPEVGDACDDGDANTELDVIQADCVTCLGTPTTLVDGQICTQAISVTDGITTSAGVDALGFTAVGACATGTSSVWYSYTATCSGITTVSSSIDLDEPDTQVHVYADCDSDCIATDDDGGEGFTSIVTFTSVAGETYLIEWDDRWNGGEFDFEISCADSSAGCTDVTACNYNDDPAVGTDNALCVYATACDTCSGETDGTGIIIDNPEVGDACDDGDATTINDTVGADCVCTGVFGVGVGATCDDAIIVAEGVTTSIGTSATGGGSASNACFTGATNAIWYAYTATSCDTVTVSSSIDLDEPDTRVSIHTAGDCAVLDCLASDDDGGEGFTSITTFLAEAGTTYYIEWDDRWDGGEFDFEISTPADTCPTDFDGNGTTDGEDFSFFLGNFGLACVDICDCPTDFNGDGITDGEDFSIFLGNFGLDCPATN